MVPNLTFVQQFIAHYFVYHYSRWLHFEVLNLVIWKTSLIQSQALQKCFCKCLVHLMVITHILSVKEKTWVGSRSRYLAESYLSPHCQWDITDSSEPLWRVGEGVTLLETFGFCHLHLYHSMLCLFVWGKKKDVSNFSRSCRLNKGMKSMVLEGFWNEMVHNYLTIYFMDYYDFFLVAFYYVLLNACDTKLERDRCLLL